MIKLTNEQAWDYAIGMSKLDGGEPSKELLDLIEQEKKGLIKREDIIPILIKMYKNHEEQDDRSLRVS